MAHQIWAGKPKLARKIGLATAQLIEDSYHLKPTVFCGSPQRVVLGGLFYLLGFRFRNPKGMLQIGWAIDCAEMSVRNSTRRWMKFFGDLFPDWHYKVGKTGTKWLTCDLSPQSRRVVPSPRLNGRSEPK